MTDKELNQALAKIQARFDAVNRLYIRKVAAQIARIGELNQSSVNRLLVMAEVTSDVDEITLELMKEAAKLLEADIPLSTEDFDLRDLCGPGYAIPSKEGNEAVELMARLQGLFLDPVYTGKAFAGLLAMAREKQFRETDHVLFLHSGGAGGLFAVT